ncbi:hypothetical protein LCGC14_1014150 [marine sediment metagenome]|uniref:Uncharacterized protein n=1 Tax=marine sediment metagenome TaxID=412755 RepID=A0A0F9MZC3_9ZZZZ
MTEYFWLPDGEYKKAIGQLRMQVQGLLADTYSMHGYKELASGVAGVIVELTEQFGKRIRGKDTPIQLPAHIKRRIKEGL